MTIRMLKRILFFLELLLKEESLTMKAVPDELKRLVRREESVDLINWTFSDVYNLEELATMENVYLFEIMANIHIILRFTIYQIKQMIVARPKRSQDEICAFFEKINLEPHYLYDKDIEAWDEYDHSNYTSLLIKHGKLEKAYAIFTTDVKDEDATSGKPSFFFDTKQEAEHELKRLYQEQRFQEDDLNIISLWRWIT